MGRDQGDLEVTFDGTESPPNKFCISQLFFASIGNLTQTDLKIRDIYLLAYVTKEN